MRSQNLHWWGFNLPFASGWYSPPTMGEKHFGRCQCQHWRAESVEVEHSSEHRNRTRWEPNLSLWLIPCTSSAGCAFCWQVWCWNEIVAEPYYSDLRAVSWCRMSKLIPCLIYAAAAANWRKPQLIESYLQRCLQQTRYFEMSKNSHHRRLTLRRYQTYLAQPGCRSTMTDTWSSYLHAPTLTSASRKSSLETNH